MFDLELSEMIRARVHRLNATDLAVAFCDLHAAFLHDTTREQCVGILTHRGVSAPDAHKIYDLITELTS